MKKSKIRKLAKKYNLDKFYIYRLRNPENKNLSIYEIGIVENPNNYDVEYEFTWNDVNGRCCEGFWGDRPLVEKFCNSMNEINIRNKKKEIKKLKGITFLKTKLDEFKKFLDEQK